MRVKRLLTRVLTAAAFCVAGLVWLAATDAHGTPLPADVQRMLAQPTVQQEFVPARAAWNGPEGQPETPSPTLQKFSERSTARAVRASIMAAAIPDPRVFAMIVAAILLLRWLRQSRGRRKLRPGLVERPVLARVDTREAA